MIEIRAIHAQAVMTLLEDCADGIRLSRLVERVSEQFGKMVTFYTSSCQGLDFDELLNVLEARRMIRIEKGVVFPYVEKTEN